MIGRKVWRYWPNEGDNGWVKGVITDYKDSTGEHVIAYDLNTSKQSYEYYNFRLASPEEYEVVMNEPPMDLTGIKGGGGWGGGSRATLTKKKPPPRSSVGIMQVGRRCLAGNKPRLLPVDARRGGGDGASAF